MLYICRVCLLCKDFLRRFFVVTPGYGEKFLYLGCAQEGAGMGACVTAVTPGPLIPAPEYVAATKDPHHFPLC